VNSGIIMNIIALVVAVAAFAVSSIFAIKQLRSARIANNTAVTIELLGREWRTDEFLESEDFVLNKLANEYSPDEGISGLPFEVRRHVTRFAQFYSSLGMMWVFDAIDKSLIMSTVSYRVKAAWAALEPYIVAERRIGRPVYLSFFEHLACVASEADTLQLQRSLGLRNFRPASEQSGQTVPAEKEIPTAQGSTVDAEGMDPTCGR
jgi:hypothetical protein